VGAPPYQWVPSGPSQHAARAGAGGRGSAGGRRPGVLGPAFSI